MIVRVYTREVDPEAYPEGLARAAHLSCRRADGEELPFNRNYGILFACGEISAEDTIVPMGIRNPEIFRMEDGRTGISGERVYEDGTAVPGEEAKRYLWTSRDLVSFDEIGLVDAASLERYDRGSGLEVDDVVAERALRYWSPVVFAGVSVPEEIRVSAREEIRAGEAEEIRAGLPEELAGARALVRYSDGSSAEKRVRWDAAGVDFSRAGTYEISGEVERQAFAFPLAKGYGDPVIFPWEGSWFFLGTNDNLDDIGIYVREARTPEGLFAEGVTEHLILPFDPARGFEQTFWAPEFHVIGGALYILFAVSGHQWGPQCHLMRLKEGGRITAAEDWEDPRPVVLKDGRPLCEGYELPGAGGESDGADGDSAAAAGESDDAAGDSAAAAGDSAAAAGDGSGQASGPAAAGDSVGSDSAAGDGVSGHRATGPKLPTAGERPITLDMTFIRAESGAYVVWSHRRRIGTPLDSGSMLYVARVDEEKPWVLAGDPVLLSRPLYGWENVAGTINNEGPYAFVRGGKVFLTYSGGSANAYTYALGLLTADSAADLTDFRSWTKSIWPVLTFYSVAGEYGPGHNAFFTNDAGELMISYHAETGLKEHLRCDGIRRVHFREDGTPYFQMSAEEDLPERERKVKTRVIVE